MSLTDVSKSICVVWDFIDQNTRFVTRPHSGLTLPSGWTQFEGAHSKPSSGAKFDLTRASLEIGDAEMRVIDVNSTVTAWLATNDATLAECRIIKRQGLMGQDESEYVSSFWKLEDYKVDEKAGGAYRFMLMNLFKNMSNALYQEFDGEAYRLERDFSAGTGLTSIELEELEYDSLFRVPGYLLFVDSKTHEQELIRYTSKNGSTFGGLTRNYFGVGASNDSSKSWNTDDTTVYHVWAKRGGPVDVFLEWLMTSDAEDESSTDVCPNGDLDDWTGGVPDDWSEIGTVTEETTIVHTAGGSAARIADNAMIQTATNFNLDADKGGYFEFWVYVDPGGTPTSQLSFQIRLFNSTRGDTWNDELQDWSLTGIDYSKVFTIPSDQYSKWIRIHVSFITDGDSFADTDNYQVKIDIPQATGTEDLIVDDVVIQSPFSKRPNGPYDQHDGDGVAVPYELVNIRQIEETRDFLWPTPTFDAVGAKTTGTAVLFVEQEPVDDLKEFAELHLMLPYALKPLMDSEQKLVLGRYHEFFPTETVIGDKWRKGNFDAKKWQRNYSKSINNATLMTDYDIERGKHIHTIQVDGDEAIEAYGRSKPLKLEGRGGRTGRLSFPQYDSISDLEVAWGRIALEVSNPWTLLEIKAFYEFRDLSQLDGVRLNIPGIPDLENGVRGMTNQLFFVDSIKLDETKGYVVLTIRHRREPFRPALIAPDGLPDYGPGPAANEVYAFIGDPDPPPETGFSDGTDWYRVI